MKSTLFDNGDFAYMAEVAPVPAPVGGLCLTITSRWRNAKDSEAEQVRFRACLDEAGAVALANLILQEVRS